MWEKIRGVAVGFLVTGGIVSLGVLWDLRSEVLMLKDRNRLIDSTLSAWRLERARVIDSVAHRTAIQIDTIITNQHTMMGLLRDIQ